MNSQHNLNTTDTSSDIAHAYPLIVFCTTCKGRAGHLEQTLPENLAGNAGYPNCKFLVLDYNSPDHLLDYLCHNHQPDIDGGRLVVYSMPPGPDGPVPFRMAHAKNLAHRCGMLEGGGILVNLDADNYTGEGFAEYVAREMRDPEVYLWSRMQPGRLARGISGRIAVRANAFLKVGGYNEKYETWSPDDKDFNARLGRFGYAGREVDERYLDAVNHNDKMRFREYKHAKTDLGEEYFDISEDDTTVANFGRFGMATVHRNFDFSRPIELGPVPTRIFGVGMHKTATTSLHTALEILGYESAHWRSAHWAKAIWQEMLGMGKSPTLEQHYALCDLPIALLYDRLDHAYPGSKFILTVRDEAAWLDSVGRHWDPATNPFRKTWKSDPFSNFIHQQLYGRKDFDADTMLERYRRHNAEVRQYFAARPDDLLVLRPGDGWEKLCGWLGKPVPSVPYPWTNGHAARA